MESVRYWCWLQQAMCCGARVDEALAAFGSPRAVYESSEYEKRISGVFTPGQVERLSTTPLEAADEILAACRRYSIHILTPQDEDYPAHLKELPAFPCALYVRGDVSVLREELSLAVVGARQATDYAVQAAYALAFSLARAGMVIVSGGALGIDSAAHRAAMDAGGKTVCYMGCGFGVRYLMSNSSLRKRIAENGALVSEFPPGTPAGKSTFPIRNRLISGGSLGTLVVEAGIRSGSLITARGARELGRDVFAVPGNILTTTFDGANQLIRDGAKPVFSARDILEEYEIRFPGRLQMDGEEDSLQAIAERASSAGGRFPDLRGQTPALPPDAPAEKKISGRNTKELPADAPEELHRVFQAVSAHEMRADELAAQTGIPIRELLRVLTRLEVMGYIVQQQGKRYSALKE